MEAENGLTILAVFSIAALLMVLNATPAVSSEGLSVTVTTDRQGYLNGENVVISGHVSDQNGDPVSGSVVITLSNGDWTRNHKTALTNGSYSWTYAISFGDPTGTYGISVEATETTGASGSGSGSFSVSMPENVVGYTVAIYSPPSGSIFSVLEEVPVSVYLTEGDNAVGGAEVWFYSPTLERVALTEIQTGVYTARYTIGIYDTPGTWSFTVEARKTVENTFRAGGSYVNVSINPASLQVSIDSPETTQIRAGGSVEVRVSVTYPDGTPLNNGTVLLSLPTGENVEMTGGENGAYFYSYMVSGDDAGIWTMVVNASDAAGNSGSITSLITVLPAEEGIPIYWIVAICAVSAVIVSAAFLIRRHLIMRRMDRVEMEKKHIMALRDEAIRKYFKEGSISRQTYDSLLDEYQTKLAELERISREKTEKEE
ncbi:MAG: hypothetical protein QXG10_05010 [Candidatus Hadarchaeales archaeon]